MQAWMSEVWNYDVIESCMILDKNIAYIKWFSSIYFVIWKLQQCGTKCLVTLLIFTKCCKVSFQPDCCETKKSTSNIWKSGINLLYLTLSVLKCDDMKWCCDVNTQSIFCVALIQSDTVWTHLSVDFKRGLSLQRFLLHSHLLPLWRPKGMALRRTAGHLGAAVARPLMNTLPFTNMWPGLMILKYSSSHRQHTSVC